MKTFFEIIPIKIPLNMFLILLIRQFNDKENELLGYYLVICSLSFSLYF